MRKLFLLLCIVAMATTQLFAQGRTIVGKVTDDSGNPVVGASVLIRGTRTGTTTRADGSFTITVPSNSSVLVISSVNFETTNVTVGESAALDVKLKSAPTNPMEEVVVIGYTQARKKEMKQVRSRLFVQSRSKIFPTFLLIRHSRAKQQEYLYRLTMVYPVVIST